MSQPQAEPDTSVRIVNALIDAARQFQAELDADPELAARHAADLEDLRMANEAEAGTELEPELEL